MKSSVKSNWSIPIGLLLLSALPLLGVVHRLTELFGGAAITKDNAHFFASPTPIVVHAISCGVYFILGALQFAPGFRNTYSKWHRVAGRILIPVGLLAAISGIWMALTYPPSFGSGHAIAAIRVLVGLSMIFFIGQGLAAIRQRDFTRHRASMMRAYALAIAAGTQPLTLGVVFLVAKTMDETGYTLGLTSAWIANLVIVEWLIRRRTITG